MHSILQKLKKSDQIGYFFRYLKRIYIRYILGLKQVHPTFNIGGKSSISHDLIAEEYSYVGPNCRVYPGVKIGRYTMLAQNVQIIGSDHNYQIPGTPITFSGRPKLNTTRIGRDVWIGANSIIMTGLTIGDGSIIAAGSIVTKDVPSFSIVGGIPAKFIKKRFKTIEDEEIHLKMLYGALQQNIRNKPLKL